MAGTSPLPLSASIMVSLALAATVGLAEVAYVLSLAGARIGGLLLAVLPVFFIAAFTIAQLVFWLLRSLIGRFILLDLRAHAVLSALTFLFIGWLHATENAGVQRVLQERVAAGVARTGSCPAQLDCLPLRPAADWRDAPLAQREERATRGTLDAEGFSVLMRDPQASVRAALARRADLPQELLERMAGDPDPRVRETVAASPRLSDDALNRLAFERNETVRLAVARNHNAPPTALDILASTHSAPIRLLVARHPRASEPVLRRLLDGSGDEAEQIAKARLRNGGA